MLRRTTLSERALSDFVFAPYLPIQCISNAPTPLFELLPFPALSILLPLCCSLSSLKEILSEALAGSDSTSGRPPLSTDSPADMAIKLMDCLIMGEKVGRSAC